MGGGASAYHFASSVRRQPERASTECLVMQYVPAFGTCRWPITEPMLTTRPPPPGRSLNSGRKCLFICVRSNHVFGLA